MSSSDTPVILVVDDDVDACENLSDILTDLGYEVDTAHDGESALGLARRRNYDVALLDLKMPGMDGLTLYREIKKLKAGTVAIIVSAFVDTKASQEAEEIGAWKVLSKPVDFPALLRIVDEVLEQPLVMIVDDDQDLCDTMWDLLRERGFRICIAHDIPDAEGHLNQRDFDVLLIDMKLPHGDGRAVLRTLQQLNRTARTVLISGFRSEMELLIQRAIDEGADAVCYKPFDVPQLLATLHRLSKNEKESDDDAR